MTDPIVDEVRAARAKIAEECGYDLQRIMQHAAQAAERITGLKYVTKQELKLRRRENSSDLSKTE
jgi:hypothetical protein